MIQGKHFDRAFLIGLVCLQAFLAIDVLLPRDRLVSGGALGSDCFS
jgi:hypothetical protein